jgi:predicted nuclease of predicted toxin-antitoxin system
MKLLIDMNLSPEWAVVFNRNGFEAAHWSRVGDPRATDRVVMEWARVNEYVVFTHDLDFGAILAVTHARGPSVIQVRTQDMAPAHLEAIVISALHQHGTFLEQGALITLDEFRARVRILPIIM